MKTKIKTFEDACKALKKPTTVPDLKKYGKAVVAYYKLSIIAEALNKKWKPNWNSSSELKWYPWFDMEKDDNNPSGFRFGGALYDYTASTVGSRLCYKTSEMAKYAGTKFEDLYRDLMVL